MLKKISIILCATAVLTGCIDDAVIPISAGGSWFNHDRRTARTIVDDQAITVRANLAIAKDKSVWKDSHISTLSYNNTLLLVGQTRSTKNKDEIENLLKPLTGIGSIYNQITVSEPISMTIRANDTWLTTQVKARIIGDRDVGMNRVKVITENSIVYLMGKLTRDEEQSTIEIVRRVPGVERVVTIIEPIDVMP